MSGKNGTMYLSEFTFRHNNEALKPIQKDFLIIMARVPKDRVLCVEAHAAVHYIHTEIQDDDEEEVESDGEIVLL